METEENRYCMSVCVWVFMWVWGGEKVKEATCTFLCMHLCLCMWEWERERECPASSGWLDKERLVGLIFSSIPAHLVTHEHLQLGNPAQAVKDSPEWKEDEKTGELSDREEGENTNNKSKSVCKHTWVIKSTQEGIMSILVVLSS